MLMLAACATGPSETVNEIAGPVASVDSQPALDLSARVPQSDEAFVTVLTETQSQVDNQSQAETQSETVPIAPAPVSAPAVQPAPSVVQDYRVRVGDSLTLIANRFGVNPEELKSLNGIHNADHIQVGQLLHIRANSSQVNAPNDKIIPDSEAVLSPAYEQFDINAVAQQYGGVLANYHEVVEGNEMSGAEIIQLVSERFSVGPRVLLTILELQGGWVTHTSVGSKESTYPMGYFDPARPGLYRQAFWVANTLNEGYYAKLYRGLKTLNFRDGVRARLAGDLNPGTVALQHMFARETTWDNWLTLIGPDGFRATYQKLFGDPMANSIEPLVPADLTQPDLRMPYEDGHTWYYTGGPHGGYAGGSAWAAVDFAPTDGAGTCTPSAEWAVAAAPGKITRAERGRVMLNLSGTDFQGDGWTLMYMHMGAAERIEDGTFVNLGQHIGHPSCEGGMSQADHLHIARLYNGQWMPAALPNVPLNFGGWTFQSQGTEYDGTMARGGVMHEACNCHSRALNGIYAGGSLASNNSNGSKDDTSPNKSSASTTVVIPNAAANNVKPAAASPAKPATVSKTKPTTSSTITKPALPLPAKPVTRP